MNTRLLPAILFALLLLSPFIYIGYNMLSNQFTTSSVRPEVDSSALFAAIAQYNTLTGTIPTTEQGLDALVKRPTDLPAASKWAAIMPDGTPKDPWGNDYQYTAYPEQTPMRAKIRSLGPDSIPSDDDHVFTQTFSHPTPANSK